MPPKSDEKPMQAVVLADSFDGRFNPMTLQKPKCLLPLVNVPMLDYALEMLVSAKITEIYIFCSSHIEQVRQYASNTKWGKLGGIHVESIHGCSSLGEALREIDSRSIIHGDFVLMYADTVSNANLEKIVAHHKMRRAHDSNAILTLVLKELNPYHRTREMGENGVFLLNRQQESDVFDAPEVKGYFPVQNDLELPDIELDAGHLKSLGQARLRYDLSSPDIFVCAPEVLALFTENFDYQSMCEDLLRGIFMSEVLSGRIYAHILQKEYAARVRSLHLYESVSHDIIQRWAYPIVPDGLLGADEYSFDRGFVYKSNSCVLPRSSNLGNCLVLGTDTILGENVTVTNSVIGPNCVIASGSIIEDSFLWGNVKVGHGCKILRSILTDNVTVKDNTAIGAGSVVSFNCVLGPSVAIPAGSKLGKSLPLVDTMQDLSLASSSESSGSRFRSCGCESNAEQYVSDNEYSEYFDIASPTHGQRFHVILDEHDETETEHDDAAANRSDFDKEATEMIRMAIADDYTVDDAALELNGLKFACDASFVDCCAAVASQLIQQVAMRRLKTFDPIGNASGAGVKEITKQVFLKWTRLLGKFCHSHEEQMAILGTIENRIRLLCAHSPEPTAEELMLSKELPQCVSVIFPLLFRDEIIEDDAYLDWFNRLKHSDSADPLLVESSTPFINWLLESDDDTDESDT